MPGIIRKQQAANAEDAGNARPGKTHPERESLPFRQDLEVTCLQRERFMPDGESQTGTYKIDNLTALRLRKCGVPQQLCGIQMEIVSQVGRVHDDSSMDAVLLDPQVNIAERDEVGKDRRRR